MKQTNTHIIKKLTLELHFGVEQQTRQVEYDALNIYRNQLGRLFDNYFTALSTPDTEYYIDKLELDLGKIKPEDMRTQMPKRVLAELDNYFMTLVDTDTEYHINKPEDMRTQMSKHVLAGSDKKLNNSPTKKKKLPVKIISKEEKKLSLFQHFINTGRLPWWAGKTHKLALEKLVKNLSVDAPIELKLILSTVVKDTQKVHRLIAQLSDQCLSYISQLYLLRHDVVLIYQQFNDLQFIFNKLNRREENIIDSPQSLATNVVYNSQPKLREYYWQTVFFSLIFEQNKVFDHTQLLQDTLLSVTSSHKKHYRNLLIDLNNIVWQLKQNGHQFNSEISEQLAVLKTEKNDIQTKDVKLKKRVAKKSDAIKEYENKQKIVEQDNLGSLTDNLFTELDEDYIYNAGLIIVWQYLPRFFIKLGMLDGNNFIDTNMAERAALLLQYLIEPDTEISESLLTLNKVLCGLNLSQTLPAEFIPTTEEKAECDKLLTAITYHWDVLRSFSLDRLRTDFFQRQGILHLYDGNWQLQVERQSHDILLEKLPWPIRVIKLPWMDYAIFVQWH